MQEKPTSYTGIAIGGPKDGQALTHTGVCCACIEATMPEIIGDMASMEHVIPDDKLAFTRRGTYYFVEDGVKVLGQRIDVWAWEGQDTAQLFKAIMAKLTARKKR